MEKRWGIAGAVAMEVAHCPCSRIVSLNALCLLRHQVWDYLRTRQYCSLYDLGYTSLGGTKDTFRNSKLLQEDGTYR